MAASTFADTDYLIPGILLGNLGHFGATVVTCGIIGFLVVVIICSLLMKPAKTQEVKKTEK